jgi:hypothetical protein
MSDKKYLNVISDETAHIRAIANELMNLSDSFADTGNIKMSDKLGFMSSDLIKIQEEINNAVGRDINDQFKVSQQATANMINAALAVGSK